MPDPLHPPTEAIERLKSDAQQQRDGGCVRQADDIEAVLGHVAALEEELVEYLAMEVAGESIPTEDGEWEELRGAFASNAIKAADRLVALNRWERHPTKPGLYRPKPDQTQGATS